MGAFWWSQRRWGVDSSQHDHILWAWLRLWLESRQLEQQLRQRMKNEVRLELSAQRFCRLEQICPPALVGRLRCRHNLQFNHLNR